MLSEVVARESDLDSEVESAKMVCDWSPKKKRIYFQCAEFCLNFASEKRRTIPPSVVWCNGST
jgi:hypothetical protein